MGSLYYTDIIRGLAMNSSLSWASSPWARYGSPAQGKADKESAESPSGPLGCISKTKSQVNRYRTIFIFRIIIRHNFYATLSSSLAFIPLTLANDHCYI